MPYTEELYHYGVLGMKWGVRRHQNKDGSYTAAGKKRYSKLSVMDKVRLNMTESTENSSYKLGSHQAAARDAVKKEKNKLNKEWKNLEKMQDEYFSKKSTDKSTRTKLSQEYSRLQKRTDDFYKNAINRMNSALAADENIKNTEGAALYLTSKGKGWTKKSIMYYLG